MGCVYYNFIGTWTSYNLPIPIEKSFNIIKAVGLRIYDENMLFVLYEDGKISKMGSDGQIGQKFGDNIIDITVGNGKAYALDEFGGYYRVHIPINGEPFLKPIDSGVVRIVGDKAYKVEGYAYSTSLGRIVPILTGGLINVCSNGLAIKTDGSNSGNVPLDGIVDGHDFGGASYYITVDNALFKVESGKQPQLIAQNVVDFGISAGAKAGGFYAVVDGFDKDKPTKLTGVNDVDSNVTNKMKFYPYTAFWYGRDDSGRNTEEYAICDGVKKIHGRWLLQFGGKTKNDILEYPQVLWYLTSDGNVHEIGGTRTYNYPADLNSRIDYLLSNNFKKIFAKPKKINELMFGQIFIGRDVPTLQKV